MDSTAIFPGAVASGAKAHENPKMENGQEAIGPKKGFSGFLSALAAASGNPSATQSDPIVSRKKALEGFNLKTVGVVAPSTADQKLDAAVKKTTDKILTGIMPGATTEQINEMKVKFSANINNLEKAMKSVLQLHGIPSPDIKVMPPEMIMVNLPDGLMENLSNVLGAFVSGFDSASGTNFSQNLKIAIQNLTSEDGKDLEVNFEGFTPKNELEFVEAAIATVTAMLGVERPAKNLAPTATQTLMLSQHSFVPKGGGSTTAPNTQAQGSPIIPAAAVEVASSPAPVSWAPDETMEEGLKSFMRSTLFAAEATSRMGGEIAKATGIATGTTLPGQQTSTIVQTVGSGMSDPATMLKPGMPEFARLETFEAINQYSSDSVSAEDFEEILSNTSKAKTTSDALSQAQANRFANLINGQIKNAELGDRKTRIELAPKGLGEIEINIENDASGKMRAVIRVENPAVLELMKTDKSQLMDLLSQKGIDLSDGSLDLEGFSREDPESDHEGGQGSSEGGDGTNGEEASASTEDDTRSKITDTTVDIQI